MRVCRMARCVFKLCTSHPHAASSFFSISFMLRSFFFKNLFQWFFFAYSPCAQCAFFMLIYSKKIIAYTILTRFSENQNTQHKTLSTALYTTMTHICFPSILNFVWCFFRIGFLSFIFKQFFLCGNDFRVVILITLVYI